MFMIVRPTKPPIKNGFYKMFENFQLSQNTTTEFPVIINTSASALPSFPVSGLDIAVSAGTYSVVFQLTSDGYRSDWTFIGVRYNGTDTTAIPNPNASSSGVATFTVSFTMNTDGNIRFIARNSASAGGNRVLREANFSAVLTKIS